MLTPNKMNNLQNNKLVDIYTAINQELTNDIINKIKSSEDITNYTKSQIKALIKNGGQEIFNEALKKVQGISRSTLNELKTIFNDLVNSQMSGYKSTFDAVGATYAVTDSMMKTINNAIKETNGTLKNMTKTVAYASQTNFVNAMDNLYMKVTSGAFDYDTALKRTVTDLAKKGVTFKTSDGRNEKIETVVKRSLFSSIQNTATDLAKEIGDIIDYNCVVIGHSYKCRPTHNPIDDVVMSKEVFKRYEYLTYEYNCNHIVNYDWREEFENNPNKIEYGDQHGTLKEVKKNYEIQQKANYYANQVKNKKMQIANGDNSEEVKRELLNAQSKYRIFCKANGLTVDYSKTWVHGYSQKNQIAKKWYDSLSDNEKRSINSYLSSDSYKINEALYSQRKLTKEEKSMINNIDNALKTAPKFKGYVNRSVEIRNQQHLEKFLSIFDNEKRTGSWGSYISSSKKVYDPSMNLQIRIKSINGRDLSILNNEGGGEVLFVKITKFKYITFYQKHGKIYLELEEVE